MNYPPWYENSPGVSSPAARGTWLLFSCVMLDGPNGGEFKNIEIDVVEPCPFCMLPKLTGLFEVLVVLMLGVFIRLLLKRVRVLESFAVNGRLFVLVGLLAEEGFRFTVLF